MVSKNKKTIALCMIVKDEAHVILRALDSVKAYVDYYCICDTGSTDNTIELVQNYLKEHNLEGKVHKHKWVDFSHNRNLSIEACEGICEYQMTLDADEVIIERDSMQKPLFDKKVMELEDLTGDLIHIHAFLTNTDYMRTQIWRDSKGFRWVGVCHEYLHSPQNHTNQTLKFAANYPRQEGARSQNPDKFLNDAKLFEKALKTDPKNSRSWFYLGQSYADGHKPIKAIDAMKEVIACTKWDEEKFMATLRIARYKQRLGGGISSDVVAWLLKAFNLRPTRLEPLYDLIRNYRISNQWVLGEMLCDRALTISYPPRDILFVERSLYTWSLLDEASIIYYYTGRYEESYDLCLRLLDSPDTPKSEFLRIETNRDFSKNKILSY